MQADYKSVFLLDFPVQSLRMEVIALGTVIPITKEKNWRSEYRYAVYEHKLATTDGLVYSRSFIVIKNV